MKNKYVKMILVLPVTGLLLTSCYKEFDPSTYAPAFTINGYSSVNQIKPGNLVGYWAFNESLIDSVSSAVAANNGTTYLKGFIGKGLSLNVANTSYILINPTAAITSGLQSFTVSFWVNPVFVDANSDNGIDGILGFVNLSNVSNFWGNIDWFVENGSNPDAAKVVVHITGGSGETWINKSNLTGYFGKWTNNTITYDASTSMLTYYINGSVAVPATATAWTGPVSFANSGPWVFGCVHFQTKPSLTSGTGSQDWASYLTGTLDEVRIYNAALTATEVNSLVVLQGKEGN
jgi:hypothetical protein